MDQAHRLGVALARTDPALDHFSKLQHPPEVVKVSKNCFVLQPNADLYRSWLDLLRDSPFLRSLIRAGADGPVPGVLTNGSSACVFFTSEARSSNVHTVAEKLYKHTQIPLRIVVKDRSHEASPPST